jgi:hypothetical protein
MKRFKHLLPWILLINIFIVSGCGYKPSAKYSREIVGEKIFTSVIISAQDPENTVVIKDAVDSAIVQIFHASLVPQHSADTHLIFSISTPRYTPLEYDDNGFVIAYRTTITLNIMRKTDESIKKYRAKGTYDFAVTPNAVITDKERFDAIKYSAQKAIASFIAQVSAEGSRKGK